MELILSSIILWDYNGHPSKLEGTFDNVPVEIGGNMVLTNNAILYSPLEYNITFWDVAICIP